MALNVPQPNQQAVRPPQFHQPAPQQAAPQAPQNPGTVPQQAPQGQDQQQGQQDPNQTGEGDPQQLTAYVQNRLQHAPREAQQFVLQALTQFPKLPTFMGITIHPAIQDFFQKLQQELQQQNSAQGQPPQAGAPQSQNPQAQAPQGAAGGNPAMATSTPPPQGGM